MTTTIVDYKKELESASKGMILIHDPEILIRLILRIIVQKVDLKHAGVILHDFETDRYVLNISRGESGLKIPAGFARFDKTNPLIQFFLNGTAKLMGINRNALLVDDLNKMLWQECVIPSVDAKRVFLEKVSEQLHLINAVACVPAYFQKKLMAILLLGEKKNNRHFDQNELDFFTALASDVAMAIRNAQLFTDLKKESEKNKKLLLQMTAALNATIDAKDAYTGGHTESVTNHAIAIARQMVANGSGSFTDQFFEDLQMASFLHDIGKIGIPESILTKPGPLTDEEFEVMKTHTKIGAEILKSVEEFSECRKGVLYHHERYDGRGYPEGLKGDDIPMIAAILTVADSFDAMISDRPYRKSLGKEVAIEEIKKNSGTQFNPLPVRALLELYQRGEI